MRRAQVAPGLALALLFLVLSGCGILIRTAPVTTSWQPPPVSSWQPTDANPGIADISAIAEAVKLAVVIVNTNHSTASGWVLDSDGIIITNQHVVDGAYWVSVTLSDHRILRATSWQVDSLSDLAVIHVNASGLPAIKLGTSGALKVGETVLAIGNSLGQGISVKQGQVVQVNVTTDIEGQIYNSLIESDAHIYQGDSGGPLVNLAGQVVGITNAGTVDSGNIALAVSIDAALPIIQQLVEKGIVIRPYMGISGSSSPQGGVIISQISTGSPAAQAGLRAGDIITAADEKPVLTLNDLSQAINIKQPGQSLNITYQRGSTSATVTVTLATRPPNLD